MALTQAQRELLDRASKHLANQVLRLGGGYLLARWQEAGLREADLVGLLSAVGLDQKGDALSELRQVRKRATDAGVTDQEWAAVQPEEVR